MLGQPMPMLIPEVIGFKLTGQLREGATATDLVLTVTEMLRAKGVVGKFVEFYGAGLSALSLPDRATIGNMAPEYGATMGFFPVDAGDAELPALHRPRRSPGRAGRGVLQGAGPLPHRRHAGAAVHRHARARPRRRGAEHRRPATPAGPRAALAQQARVAQVAVVVRAVRDHRPREARALGRRGRQSRRHGRRPDAGSVRGRHASPTAARPSR